MTVPIDLHLIVSIAELAKNYLPYALPGRSGKITVQ